MADSFQMGNTGVGSGGGSTNVSGGGVTIPTPAVAASKGLNRQQRIQQALQQIYGSAFTPQLMQEAQNFINTKMGLIGSTDPNDESNAYQNLQFNSFLQELSANPSMAGQANATAFSDMQTNKANEKLASAIAPGSTLYNQYFGESGIVPAQLKAYQSTLDPMKTQDTENLSENLAARGLSTSGAYGAGQTKIDEDYAKLMNQAFLNLSAQGTQNLTNQATSGQNYSQAQQASGMDQVTQAITQNQQQQQANELASKKAQASGWSWLTPVATAVGTIAGGPIGSAIGAAIGGTASQYSYDANSEANKKQQAASQYGPTTQNTYGRY